MAKKGFKVSVDFYKKTETILIIITILLLLFLWLKNSDRSKRLWGSYADMGVPCFTYECGGMQPVGSEPKVCPSHCKCGAEDPMIPDAPRKCEPKNVTMQY
tara:strand:+ start:12872 stop:13174 length:303 start_codon:yes stop_codon:yes gene_type:complete